MRPLLSNQGRHADDQKLSEVLIAHLRDPPQLLLSAAGFVRRRQTQPRGKLAPVAELMPVANVGDDGRGCHNTDAGYRAQQAHTLILFGNLLQTILVPSDPSVQRNELFTKVMDHLFGDIRQVQNLPSQNVLGKTDDPSEAPCDVDAKLGEYALQSVNQLRALANEKIPSAVYG